jgi:O-antigen ligase
MLSSIQHNKQYWLAALIFLICGSIAIVAQEPLIIAVAFVYVLLPLGFNYTISFTEHLFWLLFLALPLSTEINITPSLGIDFPDELLLMLLTGMVIVKLLHKPSFFPLSVLKHRLFLFIVLQLLWVLVCCIYSQNTWLSFKFFLAHIWYIIPFVVLPQYLLTTPTHFKRAALFLLLPMAFVVVQCLARHALTGFSFEGIKQTLSPFFRNHVNYSAMLVCLLAVLWCVRSLIPKSNPYYKWINIGFVVGLVALFFAYSRGAWIALFAGVATVFIIKRKWIVETLIITTITVILSIGWLVIDNHYVHFAPDYEHTIFHSGLSDHLQSTTSLKDLSNAERFYRWVAGAKMFAAKPITGFGPNTFYSNYKNYTVDIFKTYVSSNPEHSSVHNYFLLTALEQGFIGLFLFCALLFSMLFYTQKLYHSLHSQFYRAIALTTGVVIVMIATINCMSDMIETDKMGSLFWLSVGVIIVLSNKLKEENESIA